MSITSALKRGALSLMRSTGMMRLAANSSWRQERLAILCYHSISREDEHEWAPALFITQEHFRNRLQWLAENEYNVVPLAEGLERLRRGDLPPRAVAITFDDGTCDFADLAWPLLERYQMPATVYWTTYYAGLEQPVFGMMCDYLLWRGRAGGADARLWGSSGHRALGERQQRAAVLKEIEEFMQQRRMPLAERHQWCAGLAEALGVDYAAILQRRTLQVMSPAEAREIARRGADVQLHTHRHRTPLDRDLFAREIHDNRERIEAVSGRRTNHFCYPSGQLAVEFFPWLEELGVNSAVTCESGLAGRDSHPYLLPRIVDTSTLSTTEFEGWLSGARLLLGKPRAAGLAVGADPRLARGA
jgi:peptidoglycan/xylan/chitin deacetylase (PgdA/CDA1 family)